MNSNQTTKTSSALARAPAGRGGPVCEGLVQSTDLGCAQSVKLPFADGQMVPSGQHWSPMHRTPLAAGQSTMSPILHEEPGAGGTGGDGRGPGLVQSAALGFGHELELFFADGHVEPSGQHASPWHVMLEPGHATTSPTLQVPLLAEEGHNHSGTALPSPSDWVEAPRSLMMCLIVPTPFKNTATGETKKSSTQEGAAMPLATTTG
mmetsp:Transcript_115193/g.325493  ORF Transcript_115193/g.325493 Transcript_115193/m.325493 type:complete len:206 (-) Transcript_115193:1701-2318(-)